MLLTKLLDDKIILYVSGHFDTPLRIMSIIEAKILRGSLVKELVFYNKFISTEDNDPIICPECSRPLIDNNCPHCNRKDT